jgi:hypothetical protein
MGNYLSNVLTLLDSSSFSSPEELEGYASQVLNVIDTLVVMTPSFSSTAAATYSALVDQLGDVLALTVPPNSTLTFGLLFAASSF